MTTRTIARFIAEATDNTAKREVQIVEGVNGTGASHFFVYDGDDPIDSTRSLKTAVKVAAGLIQERLDDKS